MSSLVAALDTFTPKQLGENMHSEYGWSYDLKEEILQVFFQLTRTSDNSTMESLAQRFQNLVWVRSGGPVNYVREQHWSILTQS